MSGRPSLVDAVVLGVLTCGPLLGLLARVELARWRDRRRRGRRGGTLDLTVLSRKETR